jgi:alkylated DNA repair dioxygenase AlkB
MNPGQNLLSLLHHKSKPSSSEPSSAGETLLKLIQSPRIFLPASALTRMSLPGADVRYQRSFLSPEEAWCLFDSLALHRRQRRDHWTRMGSSGREIAQWSQPGGRKYIFSDTEYTANEFPDFVLEVKQKIEQRLFKCNTEDFNYCVANYYVDGKCGVNWHSDSEPELVDEAPIACVSIGTERIIGLRHKRTLEETHVLLNHGSLFVMAGLTQTHYLHSILKEAVVNRAAEGPRFSLTFRVHHKS